MSASTRGLLSSADAGISSEKTGENPVHRKPKVSAARLVRCRSAGPKARAVAVVDGQTVYIPSLGVKAKRPGTLFLLLIQLLVRWFRKVEWTPSGGSEVRGRKGLENPSRYNTSNRTANRHR